jgi:hypothetical protein
MTRYFVINGLAILCTLLLMQSTGLTQQDKGKGNTKPHQVDSLSDRLSEALREIESLRQQILMVDSLSDRISVALREIESLKQQNRILSEKVESFQLAKEGKQSGSDNRALSLIKLIALIAAVALGSGGTILYRRWRRRRQGDHRENGSRSVNPAVNYRLNELSMELRLIKEKQRLIDDSLRRLESRVAQPTTPLSSQRPSEWRSMPKSPDTLTLRPTIAETSPLEKLVSAYHAALKNENERSRFREIYRISRIGVLNAMERRRDSNLYPVFQTASDGDYYAIEIGDQGRTKFAVVPRFDLTLQESNYVPGAIGIVFNCSGFNPNLRYRHFRLISPAFFAQAAGENWNLIETGELELGEGE